MVYKIAGTTLSKTQMQFICRKPLRHSMHSIPACLTRAVWLALALALLRPAPSGAQPFPPPGNDRCTNAIIVPPVSPTSPFLSNPIEVSAASNVGDPPGQISCAQSYSRSIWFQFRPDTSGLYTMSFGADTGTTVDDTVMAIFTSSTSSCSGPFNLVSCNDDSGVLRSAISTNLTAGTTYFILGWVGPVTEVTNPPIYMQLRVTKPVAPTNDTCSGAEIIPTNATFPYTTLITDTTLATETNDPVAPCLSVIGVRSVWYKFSPPTTGIYIISTGSDTGTSVDDTALAIFRNNTGCGGTFTSVTCSDNGVGRAIASALLTNGQTYYIVAWDNGFDPIPGRPSPYIPSETFLQLRVSKATAPTVSTLGASSIASTGAVLSASVNPNGAQSRYWFEWGTNTSYGNTSAVKLLLTSTATITNAFPIGVPPPNIPYPPNIPIHYRVVGTNSIGRSNGLDRTFLWSSIRPVLNGAGAVSNSIYGFTFAGNTDQLYLVEMSTNLVTWTNLGPAQATAPGQYQFSQGGAAFLPQRFFRLRSP